MPVIGFGFFLGAKFRRGMREKSEGGQQIADLLAGDAIVNYRTVASFANEETIIAQY